MAYRITYISCKHTPRKIFTLCLWPCEYLTMLFVSQLTSVIALFANKFKSPREVLIQTWRFPKNQKSNPFVEGIFPSLKETGLGEGRWRKGLIEPVPLQMMMFLTVLRLLTQVAIMILTLPIFLVFTLLLG